MKRLFYWTGRALQLTALFALPSAIWVGQFGHNEKGSILIFVGSVSVFFLGYFLTRIASSA